MPILVSQKLLLLKDDKGAIVSCKLLEKRINMSFTPFKGLNIRDEFGDVYFFGDYNHHEYYAPADSLYVLSNEDFYDEKSREDVAKIHISQRWKLVDSPKFRKRHMYGPLYPIADELALPSHYFSLEGENYHFHAPVAAHK
jgi:hypothetical protein